MTPLEIVEDIQAAYDEAADVLRTRRESLGKHYKALQAGLISEPHFREVIGFDAGTAAFEVSDSLRRLGNGLYSNAQERKSE